MTITIAPRPFRLGGYSNDPKEHEQEILERQKTEVREVGGFLLQKAAQYQHWIPRTKDGKPLPRALEGRWLHPDQFRVAAEKYLSGQISKGRGKNAE